MPVAVSNNQKRSLRAVTWLVILLLGLPIGTEFLLHFGLGLGNPVLIAPDSACSYTLAPSQNTYRFFCRTHTDRFGMRSDPFAPTPAPGTLRIMFVVSLDRKCLGAICHAEVPGLAAAPGHFR